MTLFDGRRTGAFPVALDGSVFGWTCDEQASHAVLDAYAEAGGNVIDTADSYSAWVPGNSGGESETIVGAWLARRRNRDRIILATKIGKHPRFPGLSAGTVGAAVDASLTRLKTDRIDLGIAHADDPGTPLEETVAAFDAQVRAGRIGAVGLSEFAAGRVREWLRIARDNGCSLPTVIQPRYHLVRREAAERDLAAVAAEERLAVMPYFSASSGFLSARYQGRADRGGGPRAARSDAHYFSHAGLWAFDALETIALERHVKPAVVALAWLRAQPGVATAIVTVRSPEQLPDMIAGAGLDLDARERAALDEISETELDD
jgi:aryl-alcohol dehydrogenase-like predicted oxidoreductase